MLVSKSYFPSPTKQISSHKIPIIIKFIHTNQKIGYSLNIDSSSNLTDLIFYLIEKNILFTRTCELYLDNGLEIQDNTPLEHYHRMYKDDKGYLRIFISN